MVLHGFGFHVGVVILFIAFTSSKYNGRTGLLCGFLARCESNVLLGGMAPAYFRMRDFSSNVKNTQRPQFVALRKSGYSWSDLPIW
jgi:hypothetical protein